MTREHNGLRPDTAHSPDRDRRAALTGLVIQERPGTGVVAGPPDLFGASKGSGTSILTTASTVEVPLVRAERHDDGPGIKGSDQRVDSKRVRPLFC
jgi:hypothetical protein